MTEKEKFISEILALVKRPLAAGENAITPTEQQIADLNEAETVDDAIKIAYNLGNLGRCLDFGSKYARPK